MDTNLSFQKIRKLPLEPYKPRNFVQPYTQAADLKVDVLQEFLAYGLDLYIRNRGASALTISVDKATAITLDAGDTFVWENVLFSLVEITSAVTFDLILAGVFLERKDLEVIK